MMEKETHKADIPPEELSKYFSVTLIVLGFFLVAAGAYFYYSNMYASDLAKLSLVILFALAVVIIELQAVYLMKARWSPFSVIRMLGLTLIVMVALVIVITQQDDKHITAIISLLGALAGYLLGKDSKIDDSMFNEPEPKSDIDSLESDQEAK